MTKRKLSAIEANLDDARNRIRCALFKIRQCDGHDLSVVMQEVFCLLGEWEQADKNMKEAVNELA